MQRSEFEATQACTSGNPKSLKLKHFMLYRHYISRFVVERFFFQFCCSLSVLMFIFLHSGNIILCIILCTQCNWGVKPADLQGFLPWCILFIMSDWGIWPCQRRFHIWCLCVCLSVCLSVCGGERFYLTLGLLFTCIFIDWLIVCYHHWVLVWFDAHWCFVFWECDVLRCRAVHVGRVWH